MSDRVALKPAEAAEVLGIGLRTLADWTAAGFVPSIKRGAVRLYSVDALRQWALEESVREGGDGKAKALGNGIGIQAPWGRTMGRGSLGRPKAPRPIRGHRAGSEADAG